MNLKVGTVHAGLPDERCQIVLHRCVTGGSGSGAEHVFPLWGWKGRDRSPIRRLVFGLGWILFNHLHLSLLLPSYYRICHKFTLR